jgi:hypothetical protein
MPLVVTALDGNYYPNKRRSAELFVTPSGSQTTPEGLITELVDRKDFWRLRSVAARMVSSNHYGLP